MHLFLLPGMLTTHFSVHRCPSYSSVKNKCSLTYLGAACSSLGAIRPYHCTLFTLSNTLYPAAMVYLLMLLQSELWGFFLCKVQ